jgi:hypothetical protein
MIYIDVSLYVLSVRNSRVSLLCLQYASYTHLSFLSLHYSLYKSLCVCIYSEQYRGASFMRPKCSMKTPLRAKHRGEYLCLHYALCRHFSAGTYIAQNKGIPITSIMFHIEAPKYVYKLHSRRELSSCLNYAIYRLISPHNCSVQHRDAPSTHLSCSTW